MGTICGIIRRSRRRSQRLGRQSPAGHDERVRRDGGSASRGRPLAHCRWLPTGRGERCSCRPRRRVSRKRLQSLTRRSKRAWPVFPVLEAGRGYYDTLATIVRATGSLRLSSFFNYAASACPCPMRHFAAWIELADAAPARLYGSLMGLRFSQRAAPPRGRVAGCRLYHLPRECAHSAIRRRRPREDGNSPVRVLSLQKNRKLRPVRRRRRQNETNASEGAGAILCSLTWSCACRFFLLFYCIVGSIYSLGSFSLCRQ